MEQNSWYLKMIAWLEKHITHRQFVYILSLVVGVLAAFAAALLKSTIHFIQTLLTENFSRSEVNYWWIRYRAIVTLFASRFVR